MPPQFVPRFAVRVDEKAQVRFKDRRAFDAYCREFIGKDAELCIRPWQRKRTRAQNRAWWKLAVGTLSEWNGDPPENWHKRIKDHFRIRSTKNLKLPEFEDLRERTIQLAAEEFTVVIPDPEQLWLD